MNRRKRILSFLTAFAILLAAGPFHAFAEETPEEKPFEAPEELLVGNPTAMQGNFFTEMFGNDTADIDVRALIHGYNLVNWDQNQGTYVFDPTVVTDVRVTENAAGDHTYNIVLANDLYYSDGTRITAWDYAFSLLLMMAPEMEQIGARIYRSEHILGSDAYLARTANTLSGVRVQGNNQINITLDHAFLPYFFEVGLLLCVPYPISVIAPGCRVYDGGNGIYIDNADRTIPRRIFTADLLRETVLNAQSGYNSHPSVSSGPYVLTSFDGTTAQFEANPYYKGYWIDYEPEEKKADTAQANTTAVQANTTTAQTNTAAERQAAEAAAKKEEELLQQLNITEFKDSEGETLYMAKPAIEKITYAPVKSAELPELFENGEIHVANKIAYGNVITQMMQRAPETELRFTNYPRVGLTCMTFACERPTVREKEVRQAIAWCLDRDALTTAYTAAFGQRVDGYFGIYQWEYLVANQQIDYPIERLNPGEKPALKFSHLYATTDAEYEKEVEAWEKLTLENLTEYSVDVEKAISLLEGAGWVLNREGQPYRAGVDDVRCKVVDGVLTALDLTLLLPEGNQIIDYIQENFTDYLREAGISLTVETAQMDELLEVYYRHTERKADLLYFGTNFHVVVDPSITYSTDTSRNHKSWNVVYSDDEELYRRAVDLRRTEPGDIYTYVEKWIAFQERYNEVLPSIPIYSNIYFDFYVPYLQNYSIGAHVTWSQAILESWFGEDIEAEAEEETETEIEIGNGIAIIG